MTTNPTNSNQFEDSLSKLMQNLNNSAKEIPDIDKFKSIINGDECHIYGMNSCNGEFLIYRANITDITKNIELSEKLINENMRSIQKTRNYSPSVMNNQNSSGEISKSVVSESLNSKNQLKSDDLLEILPKGAKYDISGDPYIKYPSGKKAYAFLVNCEDVTDRDNAIQSLLLNEKVEKLSFLKEYGLYSDFFFYKNTYFSIQSEKLFKKRERILPKPNSEGTIYDEEILKHSSPQELMKILPEVDSWKLHYVSRISGAVRYADSNDETVFGFKITFDANLRPFFSNELSEEEIYFYDKRSEDLEEEHKRFYEMLLSNEDVQVVSNVPGYEGLNKFCENFCFKGVYFKIEFDNMFYALNGYKLPRPDENGRIY